LSQAVKGNRKLSRAICGTRRAARDVTRLINLCKDAAQAEQPDLAGIGPTLTV